ncbi:MAG: hypothetical protein ABW321_16405, partial [Polyangiales bacterium]
MPARPQLSIINTDKATSLSRAFASIRAIASAGAVEALFILCHGESGANKRERISLDAGGMGLFLGSEGLRHHNVSSWSAIRGKVKNIV